MLKYYDKKYKLIKLMNDYQGFYLHLDILEMGSDVKVFGNHLMAFPFTVIMSDGEFDISSILHARDIEVVESEIDIKFDMNINFQADPLNFITTTINTILNGLDDINVEAFEAFSINTKIENSLYAHANAFVAMAESFEALKKYEDEVNVNAITLFLESFASTMAFHMGINVEASFQDFDILPFEVLEVSALDVNVAMEVYEILQDLDEIVINIISNVTKSIVELFESIAINTNKVYIKNNVVLLMKQILIHNLATHDNKTLGSMDEYNLDELSKTTIS